jgi:hypothetical protein
MKTIKASKDLSLKDGSTITKGTLIEFVRHSDMPSVGIWNVNGVERKMRYRSIIKQPSIASLERWDMDGICNSVFGARVEPDGYGPQGEPSWILAMGMI